MMQAGGVWCSAQVFLKAPFDLEGCLFFRARKGGVAKAPHEVIVDHSGCLYESVHDRGPDEPEAARAQVFGHRV
jgi:hypothetical protein